MGLMVLFPFGLWLKGDRHEDPQHGSLPWRLPGGLLDSAGSGDADMDMLEQAVGEGLRRGLITRAEIKQAKSRVDAAPVMKQILEKF